MAYALQFDGTNSIVIPDAADLDLNLTNGWTIWFRAKIADNTGTTTDTFLDIEDGSFTADYVVLTMGHASHATSYKRNAFLATVKDHLTNVHAYESNAVAIPNADFVTYYVSLASGTMYVGACTNGGTVSERSQSSSIADNVLGKKWYIGAKTDGTYPLRAGTQIESFGVSSGKMTNAEIEAVASGTAFDATTATVVRYYQMNEGSGGVINDKANTGNAAYQGAFTGLTWVDLDGGSESYFDISHSSYTGKSFYVGTQEIAPLGLAFSANGLAMYVVGEISSTVWQYTLTTAWDVSTASYSSKSFSVAEQVIGLNSVEFSPSGTIMYAVGIHNDTVCQYTLGTAWDVSTASYSSKSFYVRTQQETPRSISFSGTGTLMYVVGESDDIVYQYTLATPWDVSTASYASKSFSVAAQETSPHSVDFNADGTLMFILGTTFDSVFQYTLGTAWDVSTASYSGKSLSVAAQDNNPTELAFKTDRTAMYFVGLTTDTVYQYDLNTVSPSTIVNATIGTIGISAFDATIVTDASITTDVLKNNTGTVLASTSGIIASAYDLSTGALVVRKTDLTSDGSGVVTFSDVSLSNGTEYLVTITIATADGVARITAG